MTSPSTAASPGPAAWLIVGLGFLALALAFSARAALSLVMPVWEAEFGWSRSYISGVGACALIVMACVAPVAGRLVDVRGPRVVLIAGLIAVAAGSAGVAVMTDAQFFAVAFGGIAALGFGVVATHVVATAVARHFDRHRGLAIGVATSGATAGQFVIVPLVALVLETHGWRWSFGAIALACAALVIPIVWLMGRHSNEPAEQSDESSGAEPRALKQDLRFVLTSPHFQILFWSFFLCGYTTTGVIETHFLPFASFCGFAPLPSAAAYGVLSAVNLVGMIGAGWLSDQVNRPALLASIYILRGLTFIVLLNIGADIQTLLIFAVAFGAVDYATVPITASLAASHLGLRVMGLAMGLISAGHAIGGATGAYLGGYLFDLYARYDWVWLSSIALAVLAGLLVLLLRDRSPLAGAPAAA